MAVGLIEATDAQRVVDDYGRAGALRGGGRRWAPAPTPSPSPLAQSRIVPCGHMIEQPWGRLVVRYVSLADADTRLAVTLRVSNADPSHESRRRGQHSVHAGFHPPPLSVTDDRGTIGTGGFGGGGSDEEWAGRYDLHPPLATDTAWIEVLGERLELGTGLDSRRVTVETFDESDRVERYLDQRLASVNRRPGVGSIGPALKALEAAGLLRADDHLAIEALAIRDALQGNGGAAAGVTREPWRSLLASRGRSGGPRGTVLVGAVTPVFDGIRAALVYLESEDEGFHCDVELNGSIAVGAHQATDLAATTVTFSAVDDLGNPYLGLLGGWSGGNTSVSGTLEFWPAIDPRAERLDIALTTDRARATIAVPLTWETP